MIAVPPQMLMANTGEYFWAYYGSHFGFSNDYYSPFVVDGQLFITSEQHYQWQKAFYFGDPDKQTRILAADSAVDHKALGHRIRYFDPIKWRAVAETVNILNQYHNENYFHKF
jgi:ribA/ribD-fused uncharacterized protein